MKVPSIPERLDIIKKDVGITEDTELGKLSGMSKSVVQQLYVGKIQSIAPRYAYKLESETGFSARWIMLGDCDQKLKVLPIKKDPVLDDLAALDPEDADVWRSQIRAAAVKVRRKQGEDRAKAEKPIDDPSIDSRRTA